MSTSPAKQSVPAHTANADLTIGQVASRTGMAVSAIRFYADTGLIACTRTAGGKRLFKRHIIRRVSFILIAQRLGYSLDSIAEHLQPLPGNRPPTRRDWEKMARGFKKDIDQRITELETLRDSLTGCIGCGCLSLKKCALYNDGDQASRNGSGPRYLMGDKSQVKS